MRLATAVVVAACLGLPSWASAEPSGPATPEGFIGLIRTLADSGRLTDPGEVGRLLGTELSAIQGRGRRIPAVGETTYQPGPEFWFKPTLAGRPGMVVPGWLGPGGPVGAPALSYTVVRDAGRPAALASADLDFEGVPAFLCITGADLKRVLPMAAFSPATDGAWLYHYEGPRLDTWATFHFVYPPECLIGVSLEQGPRVRRIRAERR